MRICLFTPTFLPKIGGAERNADLLARGLSERGHDVLVLAQRGRNQRSEPQVPYPVRWFRRLPAQHLWPEYLCWNLWRTHRTHPFDVCLAFYSYPTGYAASLLKKKLGFGLVISPRGTDLYANNHMLRKPRVAGVIAAGYRGADEIVSISNWLVDRLHIMAGANLPPIEVVHNGTDQSEFYGARDASRANPPELGLREPFILHLARVARIKGHALLLDALPRIAGELRHRNITYAIVGDGSEVDSLKRGISERRLEDVVKFLGPRTGVEKAWLMDRALFNVTTSFEEALGSVLVESITMGLPMLASDLPAHRELLDNRDWGMTFRSGDATDLAGKLLEMLQRDLPAMRQQAQQLAPEYSLSRMIDRYEQACVRAMQTSKRRMN